MTLRMVAWRIALPVSLACLGLAAWLAYHRDTAPALIEGIFWQPDNATARPHGNWQLLGASTLAVQWLVVDRKAWYPASGSFPLWERQPDWERIAGEPWAAKVIAGLGGRYDERKARASLPQLEKDSFIIARAVLPFKPAAYYFPVEADPSWLNVHELGETLRSLPRPLWVSVYAGERMPQNFDLWVQSWLPADVNVFFQDGVGVGTRTPREARQIADQLIQRLGAERVAIVLEAFQPAGQAGFRPASTWQITRQLRAYCGLRIYAFDGPHYLSRTKVRLLHLWASLGGMERCNRPAAASASHGTR